MNRRQPNNISLDASLLPREESSLWIILPLYWLLNIWSQLSYHRRKFKYFESDSEIRKWHCALWMTFGITAYVTKLPHEDTCRGLGNNSYLEVIAFDVYMDIIVITEFELIEAWIPLPNQFTLRIRIGAKWSNNFHKSWDDYVASDQLGASNIDSNCSAMPPPPPPCLPDLFYNTQQGGRSDPYFPM